MGVRITEVSKTTKIEKKEKKPKGNIVISKRTDNRQNARKTSSGKKCPYCGGVACCRMRNA